MIPQATTGHHFRLLRDGARQGLPPVGRTHRKLFGGRRHRGLDFRAKGLEWLWDELFPVLAEVRDQGGRLQGVPVNNHFCFVIVHLNRAAPRLYPTPAGTPGIARARDTVIGSPPSSRRTAPSLAICCLEQDFRRPLAHRHFAQTSTRQSPTAGLI